MKLKVYTKDGSSFSEKEFSNLPTFEGDKALFALKETLGSYMANARQGNACAKDYGMVSGTNKKPFKQKGTGRGRQGTLKSPIHKGGAVVFGPKPRDYSLKANKTLRRLAFQRALFDIASEGSISLIEDFQVSERKTKLVNAVLKNICPKSKNILLVSEQFDDNTALSARNIAGVTLTDTNTINALDLVSYDFVLVTENGFNTILTRANA